MNYIHNGHVMDIEKHVVNVHYTPKKRHNRPRHIWASPIFFWKNMKQAKSKQWKKKCKNYFVLPAFKTWFWFNMYSPIISKHQPLEVVRPSLVAFEPFSTYTLLKVMKQINVKNIFSNIFWVLKNYEMPRDLWRTLSPLLGCFVVFILLFITSMGNMKKRSPLLSHL